MEKPRGCAECLKTDKPLNQYSFYNLLGQQFILFVCSDCIMGLSDMLNKIPLGEQASYLTHLGQIISNARDYNRKQ